MKGSLLNQIEEGALDASIDLAGLLRKCIALGGATGSERLREWASLELKGFGPDDPLPAYRGMSAPLLLDAQLGAKMVIGQVMPPTLLPDYAQDKITTEFSFRQPIAEVAHLLFSAQERGQAAVQLAPPGSDVLVVVMNDRLAKAERARLGILPQYYVPAQVIERFYWSVSLSSLTRVLDVVRTTLVELVAEMRAVTPVSQAVPSRDAADQAVDVAVYGKRNRVVITQVAPGGQGAAGAGGATSVAAPAETRFRSWMWWILALAGIVAAVAGVWALFLR